jgi:DNA repair protein RecO (recombination protein O)
MICKTEVIVLGLIPYKENNLIVKTLSKQYGIKTYFLSRSAAKSKRKERNNYQVFSLLEVVSKSNSKSNLSRITESKNLHLLLNLRTDVGKNAIAFLLAETLSKCVQEEEANQPLFDFVRSKIIALDQCTTSFANFHLHFICQLTKQLGICPAANNDKNTFFDIKEGEFTKYKPQHSHFLNTLESQMFQCFLFDSWEVVLDIKLSGQKRFYLLTEILKYFQYHVPGFEQPKSLEILNDVFS